MPTSFAFTTAQLAEIDRLRVILAQPENKSQPSGAVPLYTYLFQCITGIDLNGSPLLGDAELARETMQQQLNAGNYNEDVWRSAVWLYGAVQVNSDNGAFSKVIREYNIRQGQLRGMGTFSDALLQEASNAVGINLANSILNATLPGGTLPNPIQGKLPTVQEIGDSDLNGVRNVLYPGNETPGTELYLNQAWPGIVMLGALGGQYTDRLLRFDDNQPVAMNSLADLKSLLYCWESFRYAFKTTLDQAGSVSALSDTLIGANLAPATISSAMAAYASYGFESFAQIAFSALIQGQHAAAREVLNPIALAGANRFLDMVLGAHLGTSLLGTTTDANFEARATAFFGALTPEQLQAVPAEFLPRNVGLLVSRAYNDVNARAALGGLSIVSVQVTEEVAARYTLDRLGNGEGAVTERWIKDRAAMVDWLGVSRGYDILTGGITGRTITQAINFEDWRDDGSLGTRLWVGTTDNPNQRAQVIFGGAQAETLTGYGHADALYGGAGDDTINAQGGHDYIEGGIGDDLLIGGEGSDPATDRDTLLGGAGQDTLEGSVGHDSLMGGTGHDSLLGGEGDDFLAGAAGTWQPGDHADPDRDTLIGGAGYDTYFFCCTFGEDTVIDSDGRGRLQIEGTVLTGGRLRPGTDNLYVDADNYARYAVHGDTLVVSRRGIEGTITVKNWRNGQLGITLVGGTPAQPQPRAVSPLVLDLDGDGVETLSLAAGIRFDHDADGLAEATGWVSSDDALLVRDLDGDGRITSGRELFGSGILLSNGQLAANGFQALVARGCSNHQWTHNASPR